MNNSSRYQAIVIGASAGGIEAFDEIFWGQAKDFRISIIVVQHIGSDTHLSLSQLYDSKFVMPFKEADEKETIQTGVVYIAPPNYHLMIEQDKSFSLSVDEKVNYSRPSIDVLFETAAQAYQDHLIGVVLTGANSDGARGLKAIKAQGGLPIVQDPETAEMSKMPQAALYASDVDKILSLQQISDFLATLNKNK
ncbi:MAG: two-component system chemotaxis response regulator CheB [Gammaproteobacteria bacterium]|jgi:two-component system chemotaxis response regulator CheB